jgi:hypothetical protein
VAVGEVDPDSIDTMKCVNYHIWKLWHIWAVFVVSETQCSDHGKSGISQQQVSLQVMGL